MKQKYLYSTIAILSILTTISLILLGIYVPRYLSLEQQLSTNQTNQIKVTAWSSAANPKDNAVQPALQTTYHSQANTLEGVLDEHPDQFGLSTIAGGFGKGLFRIGQREANFGVHGDYWDITSDTHPSCVGKNSTNSCTEGVSFLYITKNENFTFVLHLGGK